MDPAAWRAQRFCFIRQKLLETRKPKDPTTVEKQSRTKATCNYNYLPVTSEKNSLKLLVIQTLGDHEARWEWRHLAANTEEQNLLCVVSFFELHRSIFLISTLDQMSAVNEVICSGEPTENYLQIAHLHPQQYCEDSLSVKVKLKWNVLQQQNESLYTRI